MKKSLFFFLVISIAVMFASCNKDDDSNNGVQFKIANVANNFKSASLVPSIEEIPCSDLRASYVKVVIDGAEYKIGTFYIVENGIEILYSNTLMLESGEHQISEFSIWNDLGTSTESDDILLSATPHLNSAFAEYVSNPLNFSFTTYSDRKTYVGIEVVCYDDEYEADFGFVYYGIGEISVHSLNFFGDFCIKKKSDYEGSLYAQQSGWNSVPGSYIDVPAIAKIEQWQKTGYGSWQKTGEYTNSPEGETIKITYSDSKTEIDSIELKLFIYVKEGRNYYDYHYFTSWKFRDDEKPLQTGDGKGGFTTYYCLGSCTPSANYIFPAWETLPSTVTYKIVGATAPGSLGGYVDAEISGVGEGYDFGDGLYASNCADHLAPIEIGVPYEMDVYSSLVIEEMPLFARKSQWAKINWLINHIGLPGSSNEYPGYTWADLQGAVWLLNEPVAWNGLATGGVPNATSTMLKMAADANANYANYSIPTGGWACVVFIPHGTPLGSETPVIQTMFIKVDP